MESGRCLKKRDLRALPDRQGSRAGCGQTGHRDAGVDHNAGRCPHTAGGRPWQIDFSITFADEKRALKFERYLKSGSGCAFAKRHLR
jgi:hypothetical protein